MAVHIDFTTLCCQASLTSIRCRFSRQIIYFFKIISLRFRISRNPLLQDIINVLKMLHKCHKEIMPCKIIGFDWDFWSFNNIFQYFKIYIKKLNMNFCEDAFIYLFHKAVKVQRSYVIEIIIHDSYIVSNVVMVLPVMQHY